MEIVSARYLLTMKEKEPLEDGAIAVELGRIVDVGERTSLLAKYPDATEARHPDSVLMPGLVNAHSELILTGYYASRFSNLESLAHGREYIDWLADTIKFKREASTQQFIHAVQHGALEMIESGVTCVGDVSVFEGTCKVLEDTGLRAIVYSEIYGGRGQIAQDLFENALAIVDEYYDPSRTARINVGLAPKAPYLLSKNLLSIISRHAMEGEIPLKIRAAESFAEMEFFYDSKGQIGEKLFPAVGWDGELPPPHIKTPIAYLADIGFLAPSPSIVNPIHLSEACSAAIADNMCGVVYCPMEISHFGHGRPPIERLGGRGVEIGLGTGASTSIEPSSLWREMREVLKFVGDEVTPYDVMRMATIGSASCLGLENQIGTLEVGKIADYIVVDLPPGHEIGKGYIYGALIKNTSSQNVSKVVVDGEVLKSIR